MEVHFYAAEVGLGVHYSAYRKQNYFIWIKKKTFDYFFISLPIQHMMTSLFVFVYIRRKKEKERASRVKEQIFEVACVVFLCVLWGRLGGKQNRTAEIWIACKQCYSFRTIAAVLAFSSSKLIFAVTDYHVLFCDIWESWKIFTN